MHDIFSLICFTSFIHSALCFPMSVHFSLDTVLADVTRSSSSPAIPLIGTRHHLEGSFSTISCCPLTPHSCVYRHPQVIHPSVDSSVYTILSNRFLHVHTLCLRYVFLRRGCSFQHTHTCMIVSHK